ncbi:MAG: dnaA [Capsulimonas sp.]|nr:dnaA [Capsulimonas sp.]
MSGVEATIFLRKESPSAIIEPPPERPPSNFPTTEKRSLLPVSSHPKPEEPNAKTQQLVLGEDDHIIALRKAWDRTLRTLANKYNKATFKNFLEALHPLSFDGTIVVLGAPSSFAREWSEKKYSQELRDYLEQHLDTTGLQLRFVTATPEVHPLLGEQPIPLQQAASPSAGAPPDRTAFSGIRDGIRPEVMPRRETTREPVRVIENNNPFSSELTASALSDKYTFDNFVVGKSNRLAQAGAMAVAQGLASTYNPLFLYGSPGLGKTHLMQAIGHYVRATLPHARVAYVSGETFTNHFVMALRDKRTEEFRRAYRNVDVWLVDDIQTIASKEQTKEEFFHTDNTLHQQNKQIVITSDRSPRELRLMDERLRSRFECGLIADISPPELEMRMAILQRKAILENLRIPDDVIAFMASLIQSNIRALEGALIKLMAYASLAQSPITKQLASDVLSSYFVERMPSFAPHPTDYVAFGRPSVSTGAGAAVDIILDAAAAHMGVTKDMILGGSTRDKDVAQARQICMYLCRELTKTPMSALAVTFGCKNHSAIAHAHSRMRKSMESDPLILAIIAGIRNEIEHSL